MATHIFDLDGTLLEYHTSNWLPGAKEMLKKLVSQGDQILFVTMRGLQDAGTEWSIEKTEVVLKELGILYKIVHGMSSMRTLYDDNPPRAVLHKFNSPWEEK